MTKITLLKALLASLILATPTVQAVIIDFEDFGATNFQHGTVVNTQYDSALFGNVTISAKNADNQGPNLAVVFDSTTPAGATTDDDLLAPFSNATLGSLSPGNILIIQENGTGCGDGICNDPDDEGARPAGTLTFAFKQAIELISLDFFDIETTAENNNRPGSEIRFFDDLNNELFAGSYFTPGTGGDNKWNQLAFAGITGIYKLEVNLYGSGAIDNLVYNVVPVPAAFWLFGTALIGFIGFSRRTSI